MALSIHLIVGGLAPGNTIGRAVSLSGSAIVTSSLSEGNESADGVSILFGTDGPSEDATLADDGSGDWHWQGLVPTVVRPGQAFNLIVTATGTGMTRAAPRPAFGRVTTTRTFAVVLENIVPVIELAPFQSPIVVQQLPYVTLLAGSISAGDRAPYVLTQALVQFDDGPLGALPLSALGTFELPQSLDAGVRVITLQASDNFDSVTRVQASLTVLRFDMPELIDPLAQLTATGVPTTSSITSWTRLEPQSADTAMDDTTQARVFDPLWLMTRQWQVGEFQAEDAGSPVQARVRATSAQLSRWRPGELTANSSGTPYDPRRAPLESLVERRPMRAADASDARMLPLALDAGLHFLRLLDANAIAARYRAAFSARYTLELPAVLADLDSASQRLLLTMAGRAPDARRLATDLRQPNAPQPAFDAALGIAAADLPDVQQVAATWLAWYDALFAEPAGPQDDGWTPNRLEYAVSVAARLSPLASDALTLSASEFDGGRLDWQSFDVNGHAALDTGGDQGQAAITETTMPSPVHVRGTPAARFWELEDAQVAWGLLPAGPTDLVHLMMIEYAGSYGNDWYAVPLTLPVGSVTRVESLVVTDSFGVRSLLRPIGDPALPAPSFSMWQPSGLRSAGSALGAPAAGPVVNRYFLPPTLARSIDGATLEEVMFLRDEMANVAWAVERFIECPVEAAMPRGMAAPTPAPTPTPPTPAGGLPRYQLASVPPEHWIPLLPVRQQDGPDVRLALLRRGAMRQADGSVLTHQARSEVLKALGNGLLYDEEVPREGTRVTRRRRMVRWIDGSTWLWTGLRNEVGGGEGSAGMRFDQIES